MGQFISPDSPVEAGKTYRIRLGIPEVLGVRLQSESEIKAAIRAAAPRISACGITASYEVIVGNLDPSLFGDEVDIFVSVGSIRATPCLNEWHRTRGATSLRLVVDNLTAALPGSSLSFGNQVEIDPDKSVNVGNIPPWLKPILMWGGAVAAGLIVLNRLLK